MAVRTNTDLANDAGRPLRRAFTWCCSGWVSVSMEHVSDASLVCNSTPLFGIAVELLSICEFIDSIILLFFSSSIILGVADVLDVLDVLACDCVCE